MLHNTRITPDIVLRAGSLIFNDKDIWTMGVETSTTPVQLRHRTSHYRVNANMSLTVLDIRRTRTDRSSPLWFQVRMLTPKKYKTTRWIRNGYKDVYATTVDDSGARSDFYFHLAGEDESEYAELRTRYNELMRLNQSQRYMIIGLHFMKKYGIINNGAINFASPFVTATNPF